MLKEPHVWLLIAASFFGGGGLFYLTGVERSRTKASEPVAFDAGSQPKSIGAQIDGLIDGVTKCSQLNKDLYDTAVRYERENQALATCWNIAGYPPSSRRMEVITDSRPIFIHAGYCRQVDAGMVMCCKSESDGGCS